AAARNEQARFPRAAGIRRPAARESHQRSPGAAFRVVRADGPDRPCRAFRGAGGELRMVRTVVCGRADHRHLRGDRRQFRPEQCRHLSRPAADRTPVRDRASAVLLRVAHRRGIQYRRRQLAVHVEPSLVAGGAGRRRDGRRVELRDHFRVRLAQPMMHSAAARIARAPERLPRLRFVSPVALVAWTIVVGTAVRLALAASVIDLGHTEAYYIAASRHWALSYYDHPPLSFWIAWAAMKLSGSDAVLVVRAPFILMFAA